MRVSQITSLADDLALALAAKSLRVQAPVPGRSIVGIEVPNADVSLVTLRGVLESEAFAKCGKPLCFAVGVDVAGSAIVADLAKMPHLLVAGTTGSGKSVFIKALAASLMMNNAPEDLRLVAIDPKMVELSHLNGLPHLLGKAETDLENIIRVLRWVAHEMDRRYKLFSATVSRHLDDYNRKMANKDDEGKVAPHRRPHRRVGGLDDVCAGGDGAHAHAHRADGACNGYPSGRGDAAPQHGRGYRVDQGQLPCAREFRDDEQRRFACDHRYAGCGIPAGAR